MTPEKIGNDFGDKWWSDDAVHPDIYSDLVGKLQDPDYVIKCKPAPLVIRAVLACKCVIDAVPKGGRILDMGCGIGAIACCLAHYGYRVEAFDISAKAIERAKALAERLGQDPSMFSVADIGCMTEEKDASFDGVLAIGLFRYLGRDRQDFCYRNIHRILKIGAIFAVVHQNELFEAFALNDGSLRFWANMIEGYSSASKLLEGKSVFGALSEMVKVPKREYSHFSISRHMETQAENPLTYDKRAAKYGFKMIKMHYPCSHLLPPYLEARVDQDALNDLKKESCADRADDWRAMFVEYEFLSLLKK